MAQIDSTLGILTTILETFVFACLAVTATITREGWGQLATWLFALVALVAISVARCGTVFLLVSSSNCCTKKELRANAAQMTVMWQAGLRGAMAFALALRVNSVLATNSPEEQVLGRRFLAVTFIVVAKTILANAGMMGYTLERLGLAQQEGY